MNKAKQVVDLLNEADSKGYADSYAGWKSIMNRSAVEVIVNFQRVFDSLESKDSKEIKQALGYMDGLLEELIKNAESLKKLNSQLLHEPIGTWK